MMKRLRRLLRLCDHRFIEVTQDAIIRPDCVILYEECVHCGKRQVRREDGDETVASSS